jgi:hypothetical protein
VIFKVRFTDNIELHYSLIDHPIADDWAKLITTRDVKDCCKHNQYFGYASEEKINQRIERLYNLADIINNHVSEKIINTRLTLENFRKTLHLMHVHFPVLETDPDYAHLHPYLSEYNDTIHWLETILAVVWGKPPGVSESCLFSINLDFNKSNIAFKEIPQDAYELFEFGANFGDLLLHYTHVGKSAQELFFTNDLECPKNQFVPQSTYCASARLYFTDNFSDTQEKKNHLFSQWEDFYGRRGGKDYFGYDVDDPNMRLGFIKIGNLQTINIDGNNMKTPETQEELDFFRKMLVDTKIIGWTVE